MSVATLLLLSGVAALFVVPLIVRYGQQSFPSEIGISAPRRHDPSDYLVAVMQLILSVTLMIASLYCDVVQAVRCER